MHFMRNLKQSERVLYRVFVHYDSKLQNSLAPFGSGTFVREKHMKEIKNKSLCNIKSIDKNIYNIRLYYSVDYDDY